MRAADILVIGAGPAGCMAAIAALGRTPGLRVLVLDKELGPRHRIGEILLTQTVIEFARHGIAEDIAAAADARGWGRKYGFAFVMGRDRTPWRIANNHPAVRSSDAGYPGCFTRDDGLWHTLMVPRHEFDQELRRIAADRGAELVEGEAVDVRVVGEGDTTTIASVTVRSCDGSESVIRPGQVIDCTGQYALLSRRMKTRVKLGLRPLSARYAYFKGVDYARAVAHGFYEDGANILSYGNGWSWIANLGNGLASVGLVSDDWEGGLFRRLSDMPEAGIFGLDRATVVDHLGVPSSDDHHYVHPDYSYTSAVRFGRNWTAAGDAAMFLDPLLSQGVTLAVTFGGFVGAAAADLASGAADDPRALYGSLHKAYEDEVETLKRLVRIWYRPEDERDPAEWVAAARRISRVFGREIGDDVAAFRWLVNLENIHVLAHGGMERDIISLLDDAVRQPDFA